MKFHKATLVGLSKTSASLQSVGEIDAKRLVVNDTIRLSGSALQFFDSSSQDYVNVLSPLDNGAYLTTSSVENFPTEVSRSAAEFGFGQGGGGNLDNAVITASAEADTITFVKGDLSTFDVKIISSGSVETASVAERLVHSASSGEGILYFSFDGTSNVVVALDTSSAHYLDPINNAVSVLSGSASTSRGIIASDISALSSSASTSRSALAGDITSLSSSASTARDGIVASISGAFTPTDTSSFLITASAVSNVITFEKGDGSSFDLIVNTGSGGGGTGSGFPFTGDAIISGTLGVQSTYGFPDDLLLIKGPVDEGEVKVNNQGVLSLSWSGSTPPAAIEGGLYYTQSMFFVGI